MLKIGLTGGIGCGKSTVTELFANRGAPIIDADQISHQLTASGQPALSQIRDQLGAETILPDGNLNRPYLKQLIFADSSLKQCLENILHPLVYREIDDRIKQLDCVYVILSIPLLFETQSLNKVDRILVIDCPVADQIARVKARDKLSTEAIRAIIAQQSSRAEKLGAADDIIDNSGPIIRLAEQVKKLHNSYLQLGHLS